MTQYQPHTPPKLHNHGFTLVELMVTITIMGIVAAFAIPNMQKQLSYRKVVSTAETIPNAIQFAKSQAVINRKPIDINIDSDNKKIEVKTTSSPAKVIATYQIDKKIEIKPVPKTGTSKLTTTLRISPKGTISGIESNKTVAIPSNAYFEICGEKSISEIGRKVTINAAGQAQIPNSGVVCS